MGVLGFLGGTWLSGTRKCNKLLAIALIAVVLFVVGSLKYDLVKWTVLYKNMISEKIVDGSKIQTQTVEKYDFSKHVSYRLQVFQAEMDSLAKEDNCKQVIQNPLSFWRSQGSATNFTAKIDLQRLELAINCPLIPFADFLKTQPIPTLYNFEIAYLEDPPVTDILKTSNTSTSSVVLVNSSSSFVIGDTVALLITVRDGEGNVKIKGGDEIRAMFVDVSSSNSTLPAKITDYDNGTYLATAVLAFVGTFRVRAGLAYSREYIQTVLLNHLMIKSPVIYLGVFKNSLADETTVCSHVPVIPGVKQTDICDVTEINGTPWYCGRPVKPWLKCTDYAQVKYIHKRLAMPLTAVEKLLMTRDHQLSLIPNGSNITLKVSVRADNPSLTRLTSSNNCSSIPPRVTWEQPEPTGYLYQGLWYSNICRRPERATSQCLRNIHMLLLGDSNARELYFDIKSRSSCKEQVFQGYRAWHQPLKCVDNALNFTLEWLPHSNPFFTSGGVDWLKASNKVIDEIPSTGRYLVHINHYLHSSNSHVSAYIAIMTAIRDSIKKLLKRNSDGIIILQGWTPSNDPGFDDAILTIYQI